MAFLEGRNLRKIYRLSRRNQVDALRGADIAIEAGEMVAIMGPSGSGKSTLMHVLGLLHAPEPGSGVSLKIDGRELTSLTDRERTKVRATQMGFVFQSFNLVPTLTAIENVALAGEYAGLKRFEARRRAREALGWVDLAHRADHRPSELSGGEQQRVALARALVNRPKLVLADEPTGNLDSKRSGELLALLRRFNREHGQTFVIVTHDPAVAQASDRVIRFLDGRIVEDRARPQRVEVAA